MSQENIEIATKAFALLACGEMEAFLEAVTDDVQWRPAQAREPYRGKEGLLLGLEEWSEAWEWRELDLLDTIDCPGDQTILVQRTRGKARGSGVEVQASYFAVCTIQEGKIARMEQMSDRAQALEAVGLSESGS